MIFPLFLSGGDIGGVVNLNVLTKRMEFLKREIYRWMAFWLFDCLDMSGWVNSF